MKKNRLLTIMLLVGCLKLYSQNVLERSNNIFIQFENGETRQITFDSKNSQPLLNKNKQKIYYLRTITPSKTQNSEIPDYTRIMEYDVITKVDKTLVEGCNPKSKNNQCISGISNLWYSPDLERIYFEADEYTTSPSIKYYSITTMKVTNLTPGWLGYVTKDGTLKVTLTGVDTQQGGRYWQEWLIDKEGNKIKALGKKTN